MSNKFYKTLKAIFALLRKPILLNLVLSDNTEWKRYIEKKWGQINIKTVNPSPLFTDGIPVIRYTYYEGGSLDIDIAFLKALARTIPGCRFFEIGTWMGQTALNIAEVASECYTLNLNESAMRSMGLDDKYIKKIGKYSVSNATIVHLKGDSATFDFSGLKRNFDLIFIDGEHHYDFVVNDTKKVFSHLTHESSVVVWHDVAIHPGSIRYEVLAGIFDALPSSEHCFLRYVDQTKCAIYSRKPLWDEPSAIEDCTYSITIQKELSRSIEQ